MFIIFNQKFAHAQTQYIPLSVVKVADVLFDVVLGVGTVVEGEVGSFKVKMRDLNQMTKLYVIKKKLHGFEMKSASFFLPMTCF